jgi:hypothetical protein
MVSKAPHRNDKPALLALIGLTVVFFAIVTFGWHRMFLSATSVFFSYLGGGSLALIAISLAYATAAERVQSPHITNVAAGYFCVLILLSALGSINTMLVNFEGLTIVRQEIDSAREAFTQLKTRSPALLPVDEFDRFENSVKEKWSSLKAEIENPQRCGQGPEAQRRIIELQGVLPAFRPLSAGGCTNIPAVIATYEQQLKKLILASPEYLAASQRLSLREKIIANSDKVLKSLEDVRKSLQGVADIGSAKDALYDAAEEYASLKQTLDSSAGRAAQTLPSRIDTASVEALGNIGQVVHFLISRWDRPTTYVYFFIAILIDYVLVLAFQRVLSSRNDPRAVGVGARTETF